jgi:hypothetical protein
MNKTIYIYFSISTQQEHPTCEAEKTKNQLFLFQMKLSTELCFVCNTPLFFSNRQLLQHHLQTNHQHVFQIETKTDRLTVGDIVSFLGIPCGLVQLNFAFPLLKQVQQQQQQQQQQQEQEEIEKEKDGCSSSNSSSKSGSNRASLVRGHRICQKMDCATKWIDPDGNLFFEWIVLFDNCCKSDMSVLNIWPKDETNKALLRNDQPTMICALHLPQHIRSKLFRTGLLPPVPTSKAAQDAYWQYSTRTAWAVFKYCGTITVPLRINT